MEIDFSENIINNKQKYKYLNKQENNMEIDHSKNTINNSEEIINNLNNL